MKPGKWAAIGIGVWVLAVAGVEVHSAWPELADRAARGMGLTLVVVAALSTIGMLFAELSAIKDLLRDIREELYSLHSTGDESLNVQHGMLEVLEKRREDPAARFFR